MNNLLKLGRNLGVPSHSIVFEKYITIYSVSGMD